MIRRKYKQKNRIIVRNYKRNTRFHQDSESLFAQGFGNSVLLLVFCVLTIIGFYTYVTNIGVVKKEEEKKLDRNIAKIESEYEELSIEIANLNTIESTEKIIKENKMIKVGDIKYIDINKKRKTSH